MDVRVATGADAEAVERIRVRGWQVAYRHVYPAHDLEAMPVDGTRWRERFEKPPRGWTTFVAGDPVAGFASIGPSRDEDGLGELYAIYVAPERWSTGAGRALILRAEERLADDYDEATLWVLEDNSRARRFYELAGWHPDGARKAEERWGVTAPEVRYRKRLRSSRSPS
jgi:ribosomal protein S18 acetylase RimI-like enzyme